MAPRVEHKFGNRKRITNRFRHRLLLKIDQLFVRRHIVSVQDEIRFEYHVAGGGSLGIELPAEYQTG